VGARRGRLRRTLAARERPGAEKYSSRLLHRM
jgi:hypothetical protein